MDISQKWADVRPVLYYDFVRHRKIHPRILVARTTQEYVADQSGSLVAVAANSPRLGYNSNTLEIEGLRVGPSGSTFPVPALHDLVGSGNYSTTEGAGFHTRTEVGRGVEDGLQYIDYRIVGTGKIGIWYDNVAGYFARNNVAGTKLAARGFMKLLSAASVPARGTLRMRVGVWASSVDVAAGMLDPVDTMNKPLKQCMLWSSQIETSAPRTSNQLAYSVDLPESGNFDYVFRIARINGGLMADAPLFSTPNSSEFHAAEKLIISDAVFSDEGSWFVEFDSLSGGSSFTTKHFGAEQTARTVKINRASDTVNLIVIGTTTKNIAIKTFAAKETRPPMRHRLAMSYRNGFYSVALNGQILLSQIADAANMKPEALVFGGLQSTTSEDAVANVRKVMVYDKPFSDLQLAELTKG